MAVRSPDTRPQATPWTRPVADPAALAEKVKAGHAIDCILGKSKIDALTIGKVDDDAPGEVLGIMIDATPGLEQPEIYLGSVIRLGGRVMGRRILDKARTAGAVDPDYGAMLGEPPPPNGNILTVERLLDGGRRDEAAKAYAALDAKPDWKVYEHSRRIAILVGLGRWDEAKLLLADERDERGKLADLEALVMGNVWAAEPKAHLVDAQQVLITSTDGSGSSDTTLVITMRQLRARGFGREASPIREELLARESDELVLAWLAHEAYALGDAKLLDKVSAKLRNPTGMVKHEVDWARAYYAEPIAKALPLVEAMLDQGEVESRLALLWIRNVTEGFSPEVDQELAELCTRVLEPLRK